MPDSDNEPGKGMNLIKTGRLAAAALTLGVAAAPADARQNYDILVENQRVLAAPLQQRLPGYPGRGVRSGQEGWVRMNFVINADGTAADPIIIDSSGGIGFERSAMEAVREWRFEQSEHLRANNTADIRFEINRGRDAATSNFMRRYRRVVMHVQNDEIEAARKQVNSAIRLGGWNLYESTMLWLMAGRVDGAEGNMAGKLEKYRRALGVSNRNSLDGGDRSELLARVLELEIEFAQYAAARQTFAALADDPAGKNTADNAGAKALEVDAILADETAIAARATIYNPCDCETGRPLWAYAPARQTFSFRNLSGNVDRFEARCEQERLEGRVDTGKTWSLPAGNCQVFVFGDDGATFDFVEHSSNDVDDQIDGSAVARGDGLD